MRSKAADIWSEIIASEEGDGLRRQPRVEAIYGRRKPPNPADERDTLKQIDAAKANRVSLLAAHKRISWNRSLSTRGRTSIAVGVCPLQKQPRRRGKPAIPKGKAVQPLNFKKEKEYFQEVDAFDLLEESPSPKNYGKWVTGDQIETELPYLASRLERWLMAKRLNQSVGPSSTLSKILEFTPTHRETPVLSIKNKSQDAFISKDLLERKIKEEVIDDDTQENFISKDLLERKIKQEVIDDEDIEAAVKKLSIASTSTSTSSLSHAHSLADLLAVCGQSAPSSFVDVLSRVCNPESIIKVGEGTYGEAYKAGKAVCKIVPIDGELRVNGEMQKRSEELLEEAILSLTLNRLRESTVDTLHSCTTFIETLDLKVCQGAYDPVLVRAWEAWDEEHGSENDHPDFPEKQCYVVFVLQHGGQDLEGFVLENYDEARGLLAQVTAALAVAEAAYEFEHRDLHWGNILLSRNDTVTSQFILDAKPLFVKTFGVQISIIDFTLSRINTGDKILFLDLSSDPDLFKGPKGNKQSETYRKMKQTTEDYWEGSFPRTNVFWLIYLVDMLLNEKTFECRPEHKRELRSLKKHLNDYHSAKDAISDPFFSDLLVDSAE